MNLQYYHRQLLTWYGQNHRILPWRDTADPYKIWISEIILQQTRVAQGYDYYLRFISRFPDVKTLAEAPEDEVMRYWQGLGYYSRARNLHAAARQIMSGFAGVFPQTYQEVRSLKGVGDYTAAAVCSFAYNLPYAVVDGNVYRVLARLSDEDTPFDTADGKKLFADLANRYLDTRHPALYNQAIMELGALCCVPQSPDCGHCPVQVLCKAYARNTQSFLPVKAKKITVKDRYLNYIIYNASGLTLLHQRTGQDIWKHLYEFPLMETDRLLTEDEMMATQPKNAVLMQTRDFVHQLTHQRLHARFFWIMVSSLPSVKDCISVSFSQLDDYALSRLTLRALSGSRVDKQ